MCANIDTEDQFDSVPDEQHVNTVMDGLMDSLNGNEGMDLTSAQRYVEGVLYADGSTRGLSVGRVDGNEGFFSKIGEGVKKVWEYIKKMFASIWGFFFKSEKKKLEEKVDVALKQAEKELDAMEKANIPVADVPKVIHKAEANIAKLEDSPQKKELEKKIEVVKAEPAPEKKAKELHEMLPEIFKANMVNARAIRSAHERMKGAVGHLQAKKKELDDKEADGHSINGQEIQQFLNGLIGLPAATESISDHKSARGWLDKAKRCKIAMSNTITGLSNDQSAYHDRIAKCEAGINAYTGEKDPKNADLNNKIAALKSDLACITVIIGITDTIFGAMETIAKEIEKAMCLVL